MPTHSPTPDQGMPSPPAADRLREERAVVTDRIERLDADLAAVMAASLDSNADDEHDPEGATIAYERAQLAALLDQARAHLVEIEAAEVRVAEGTYGSCDVCHEPIHPERLEARPTARTCVRHADQASRPR